MYCYIYEKYKETQLTTDELIQKSLKAYLGSTDYTFDKSLSLDILRTEKGKPYLKDLPIKFSVSHSENLCVCLVSDIEVGIDVQKLKDDKSQRIAERYFTEEEKEYLKEGDSFESFYRIWTRKEAYGKMLGIGISSGLLRLDTVLAEKQGEIIFQEININEAFICTCCSREKRTIWIKKIR